jgi:hypothetical protein
MLGTCSQRNLGAQRPPTSEPECGGLECVLLSTARQRLACMREEQQEVTWSTAVRRSQWVCSGVG